MTARRTDQFVPYLVVLRLLREVFSLPQIAQSKELDELNEGAIQIVLRSLARAGHIKVRLLADMDGRPRELGRGVERFKVDWINACWPDSEWHQGDLEHHFELADKPSANRTEWPWSSIPPPEGFIWPKDAIERLGGIEPLLRLLRLRAVRSFYYQDHETEQTCPLPFNIWYSTHAIPVLETGIVWTPAIFTGTPIYCLLVIKQSDLDIAVVHMPAAESEPKWVNGPATHEVGNSRNPGGPKRTWDWEGALIGLFKFIEDGGSTRRPDLNRAMAQWFVENQDLDGHPDESGIRKRVRRFHRELRLVDN